MKIVVKYEILKLMGESKGEILTFFTNGKEIESELITWCEDRKTGENVIEIYRGEEYLALIFIFDMQN